jgi:hypothetical protein
MSSITRPRLAPLVLGLLLAGAVALPAAHADTVSLGNGDLLYGQVDLTQISIATSGGVIQVPITDLSDVELSLITGADLARYKNGTAVGGIINGPSYTVKLATGQTVVLERWRVRAIKFRGR